MINNNIIKWIAYGIEAAFLIVFIVLCVAISAKNKTIRTQKQQLKAQIETIDSLKLKCDQLWGMDCVSISVICNLQQKGVVNLNQSTQISKSVAEYTRGELLTAIDSLNKVNKKQ